MINANLISFQQTNSLNEIQLTKRSENYDDCSFEKLKLNRQELIPPSSDSSAGCLTDKAAYAEEQHYNMPIENHQSIEVNVDSDKINKWQGLSDCFRRMIHNSNSASCISSEYPASAESLSNPTNTQYQATMSDIKAQNVSILNKKQENHFRSNTQYIFNISDLSARRSEGHFESLKIEDKLMQKHIHSQLRLEQLRRNRLIEESHSLRDRPNINKNTQKIINKNKEIRSTRDSSIQK